MECYINIYNMDKSVTAVTQLTHRELYTKQISLIEYFIYSFFYNHRIAISPSGFYSYIYIYGLSTVRVLILC